MEKKKPYSAPTITDHGDAVEKTTGLCGDIWEITGNSPVSPPLPPGGGD